MKLLIDENLSPSLVSVGHARGYDSTCARDRNLLGASDQDILDFCIDEDRVGVTNNADDFRGLVGRVELHPGLIVMPNVVRDTQVKLLTKALVFVEEQSAHLGVEARNLMVNRVVEIDHVGICELHELPAAG